MESKLPHNHPLRKLFAGLVEQVFMGEIGICEPRLTAYLTDLLGGFVHVDQIYRLRSLDGEQIRSLSEFEADARLGPDVAESERTRLVNRYIGDFTLFWTGVYPEFLHQRKGGDAQLAQYVTTGKRSYGIAGELTPEDGSPSGDLLRQLSDEFECCVHGLHLVRQSWSRPDDQLSMN